MMPDPRSTRQDIIDLVLVMTFTFVTTFVLLWVFAQ